MIPVFDLTRIMEWVAKGIATGLMWIAAKVVIAGLIVTFVPMAIYKASSMLAQHTMQAAEGAAGSTGMWGGSFIEYTGLAGWFATQLKLPECFSIYMGALAAAFALSFFRKA